VSQSRKEEGERKKGQEVREKEDSKFGKKTILDREIGRSTSKFIRRTL